MIVEQSNFEQFTPTRGNYEKQKVYTAVTVGSQTAGKLDPSVLMESTMDFANSKTEDQKM
jgi:hypothetical protein